MLVSPPDQIVRQSPDEQTIAPAEFTPLLQAIEILVEFPDGRTRPLAQTTLYVDNVKVAENNSAPFDRFIWDLRDYEISGQHILSVEAVDQYGLKKTSAGVPVVVTIVRPQRGLLPFLSRNRLWVALGAILFAGSALGVILATGRARRRPSSTDRKARRDPLTQPLPRERTEPRKWNLPGLHKQKQSEAYLLRLKDDGQPLTAPPIPIPAPEMTFGSDPLQATRILNDASVSPLHARLREQNGDFILSDEKSVAGTWVNYEPLTTPQCLQHGDLIQIGRVSYRFMLRKPPEKASPKVTPTKP